MTKKSVNAFASIIAEHQKDVDQEQPVSITEKKNKTSKRSNPDYSPVTVYIPTEIYARAQFEMTRRGRKREMSDLFTELLEQWLKSQIQKS